MKFAAGLVALGLLWLPAAVQAQDHSMESIATAIEDAAIPDAIRLQLAESGFSVKRGTRTVCEFWPVKELAVTPDFTASLEVLYPFQPGQLIGVLRLPRKAEDFRGQQIAKGTYSVRYAQQPVDGNHAGTSPTRDFLLLVPVELDTSADPIEYKELVALSCKASGTTHPAMFCLRAAGMLANGETATLAHVEEHNLWVLRFTAAANSGSGPQPLVVDMVVVGKAEG